MTAMVTSMASDPSGGAASISGILPADGSSEMDSSKTTGHRDKRSKQHYAATKIQAYVRGCISRALVSDMVADLLLELLGDQSGSSDTYLDSDDDYYDDDDDDDYDNDDDDDDDDSDENANSEGGSYPDDEKSVNDSSLVVDGLAFPSTLPKLVCSDKDPDLSELDGHRRGPRMGLARTNSLSKMGRRGRSRSINRGDSRNDGMGYPDMTRTTMRSRSPDFRSLSRARSNSLGPKRQPPVPTPPPPQSASKPHLPPGAKTGRRHSSLCGAPPLTPPRTRKQVTQPRLSAQAQTHESNQPSAELTEPSAPRIMRRHSLQMGSSLQSTSQASEFSHKNNESTGAAAANGSDNKFAKAFENSLNGSDSAPRRRPARRSSLTFESSSNASDIFSCGAPQRRPPRRSSLTFESSSSSASHAKNSGPAFDWNNNNNSNEGPQKQGEDGEHCSPEGVDLPSTGHVRRNSLKIEASLQDSGTSKPPRAEAFSKTSDGPPEELETNAGHPPRRIPRRSSSLPVTHKSQGQPSSPTKKSKGWNQIAKAVTGKRPSLVRETSLLFGGSVHDRSPDNLNDDSSVGSFESASGGVDSPKDLPNNIFPQRSPPQTTGSQGTPSKFGSFVTKNFLSGDKEKNAQSRVRASASGPIAEKVKQFYDNVEKHGKSNYNTVDKSKPFLSASPISERRKTYETLSSPPQSANLLVPDIGHSGTVGGAVSRGVPGNKNNATKSTSTKFGAFVMQNLLSGQNEEDSPGSSRSKPSWPPPAPVAESKNRAQLSPVNTENRKKIRNLRPKGLNFAGHRALINTSATKIQALARGYLYRKKDFESMVGVLDYLQQFRAIKLLGIKDGDDKSISAGNDAPSKVQFKQSMAQVKQVFNEAIPSEKSYSQQRKQMVSKQIIQELDSKPDQEQKEKPNSEPTSDAPALVEEVVPTNESMSKGQATSDNYKTSTDQAATRIQAIVRGRLARKVNYREMRFAAIWFNHYNATIVSADAQNENRVEGIFAFKQMLLNKSASKIQALSRGYATRRNDYHAIMYAMDWLCHEQQNMDGRALPASDSAGYPSSHAIATSFAAWQKDGAGSTSSPPIPDMEMAITFLKKRESQQPVVSDELMGNYPHWFVEWFMARQQLLRQNTTFNGEELPFGVREISTRHMVDALTFLEKFAEPLEEKQPPTVTKQKEGLKERVKVQEVKSSKLNSNEPDKGRSWQSKWQRAKNKVLGKDGEERPSWLQKRVDAVKFAAKQASYDSDEEENETVPDNAKKAPVRKKMSRRSSMEITKGLIAPPSRSEMEEMLEWVKQSEQKAASGKKSERWLALARTLSSDDVEKTLMILKNKEIPRQSTANDSKTKKKEKKLLSQLEIDTEKTLLWLKKGKAPTLEDEAYFKKLHTILPKKEGQTKEARAKEMAKAMKWVNKDNLGLGQNFDPSLDASHSSKIRSDKASNNNSSSKSRRESVRSPKSGKNELSKPQSDKKERSSKNDKEERDGLDSRELKDYKNALKWLTSKKRDTIEDAHYFERLDAMIGKSSSKSVESRAKSMAKALQWVRSDEDKKRHEKGENTETSKTNSPKGNSDSKGDKKGETPESKKAESKSAGKDKWKKLKINLSEAKKKAKNTKNDDGKKGDKKKTKAATKRENDTANALQWLKTKGDDIPDSGYFKKLNLMISKKSGQSQEERAAEMAVALDFLRKLGMEKGKKEGDNKNSAKSKFAMLAKKANGLAKNGGGSTGSKWNKIKKNLSEAKNASKKAKKEEAQNDDASTSKKSVSSRKERKHHDTSSTKKTDSRNAKHENDDVSNRSPTPSMKKRISSTGSSSSGGKEKWKKLQKNLAASKEVAKKEKENEDSSLKEEKKSTKEKEYAEPHDQKRQEKDLKNALAWLTRNSNKSDERDLQDAAYFKKLDLMMPVKPDQTIEDRAEDMVKMLDWVKKKGLKSARRQSKTK